jgi:hypothetical protein
MSTIRKWWLLAIAALVLLSPSIASADGMYSQNFTVVATSPTINNVGTAIAFHQLTWNVVGTASVCTVALDTSADGITWSAGGAITGQTCTSNGTSTVTNHIVNYVRINVTAITVTAGSRVNIVWNGYVNNPAGGGGSVTGSGASPQVAFWSSPSAIAGDSQFSWNSTNHSAFIGPAESTLNPFLQGWYGMSNTLPLELTYIGSGSVAEGIGVIGQGDGAAIESIQLGVAAGQGPVGMWGASGTKAVSGTFPTSIGVFGTSSIYGGETATVNTSFRGGFGGLGNGSTGNITSNYVFDAESPELTGSGTISNSYGLFVAPQGGSEKITNSYGVYLAAVGTGANDYAFYDAGSTDKSLLGIVTATSLTTPGDGTHPGIISFAGNTTLPTLPANTASIIGSPAATQTSWSLQLPTAIPTTGHLFDCTVTSTNCLLHDSGVVTANVVNASSPGAGLCHFAGSTQTCTSSAVVGADMTNATVTATQLAAQYSKGSCTEVWGGSGTSFAMTAGDDAVANNGCYNDSGVTRTITAVKCRGDNASNTTVLTPTFGSAGTGTAILTGTLTCGNSYAYSATGTLNNTAWTTGTGIDPGMSTVGNATSIAMIVEYTF